MLTTGPNLGLLDNGNYGEGNYHELLRLLRGLDTLVQPCVKSATTLTPPVTPAEGDAYVVPASATGLWAGQTGMITRWTARNSAGTPPGTPLWEFFTPKKGWLVALDDEAGKHIKFNGTTWYDFTNDATAITQSLTDEAAASAASASTSASTALAQATTATNEANVATDQADLAMTQAGIATTQAGIATTQAGIASAQQSIATTKAADAASSATASATSAATASTKASDANTSANVASAQATIATTQAGIATTQATTATTQAGIATTKANEAASSAAALASSLESFRSQSLGDFASDPTVDGNGDPLQEGAEYFNTASDKTCIYVNGAWQDYDYSAQQLTVSAGLSATNAAASAGTAATQAGIASTQAGLAADHAAAASTSAGTASAQASTATTQAGIATTQATTATTQAGIATTKASDASASATTATTQAGIATTQATTATTQAGIATAQATTATTQAGTATTQASSATGSATAAAASATTATNQAAAAAASALSAASVVSQDLSAIDKTLFPPAIVDTFLYDTEKDSDGGAWRKRCAHTSWENETLSGNWLGSAANETAARAISGATTGSYYYDTTAAGFYTLNAGSGKTATYRGNVRQFPAKVLITVEAARVVLWDLTQANCPMWMVFVASAGRPVYTTVLTSVAMLNGEMVVGAITNGGLGHLSFPADRGYLRINSTTEYNRCTIANRNSAAGDAATGTTAALVARNCNDIAMTVLPNAPVDVATGLPVPTIAVATDGNATYSTSVIKDDGTVVNVASDSTGTAVGVEFDGLALKVIRSDGNVYYWNDVRALTTGASPSATVSASTTPAALGTASKQAKRALSSSTGLTLMRRNQLTLASSMLAYITKDYNSGWMPGDIRGAWLADTVAGTLTGTELVTNGTFTTDTSGWTNDGYATISVDTGRLKFEQTSAASGAHAGQAITTVSGKTYTVSFDWTAGTQVNYEFYVGTSQYGSQLIASGIIFLTAKYSVTFIATGTTTYLTFRHSTGLTGRWSFFDNVSCRLADVDRSVKAKGLQAFGSLTKAAVASGAALMGYSGFSAANYLEQPYNSDLDFGTGDFCIMGWAKFAATAAKEVIFCRDSPTTGKLIRLQVDVTTSYLSASAYDGTTTRTATGAVAIDDATWKHVLLTYSAGTLTIYVNGVSYATATGAALLTLNNATAVCDIGVDSQHVNPATNGTLALWRAGATAPSAEQIKHIYETEKALFEANAQCCLAGTSNAVTALAYDDETDLLHVGTSYGRSAFNGLVRVSSEATPVGAITALAASAGVIAQAGASGADVYVPAYTLREELLRDAEQMAKFGQNLIAHDFTATASQTTFTLPVGWEIVAVYQQGSIKRETTSWTRSFDGFKWSAVLGTGATVSDWISILAKRV